MASRLLAGLHFLVAGRQSANRSVTTVSTGSRGVLDDARDAVSVLGDRFDVRDSTGSGAITQTVLHRHGVVRNENLVGRRVTVHAELLNDSGKL